MRDIRFVSSEEASFSGTSAGGVLTVTDGRHTAHIALSGDYVGSYFVVSRDGQGGVIVVDEGSAGTGAPPTHQFVSAMAHLGGPGAAMVHANAGSASHPELLASPTSRI